MKRRTFLGGSITAALSLSREVLAQKVAFPYSAARHSSISESAVGQPVNLASYGELRSWLSPEAAKLLESRAWVDADSSTALRVADLPWKDSEVDVGVEWPEFRTIHRVVIRFAAADKAPHRGRQILEYWSGLTSLQGSWKAIEDGATAGNHLEVDGATWIYTFPARRTSKVRLRLQGEKHVEIDQFSIFGPSVWKAGEVLIQWGYNGAERSYDGSIETYNAELLSMRPLPGTQIQSANSWASRAGDGRASGVIAWVLYASGLDVDRSIITIRGRVGDISFLPGEAIEQQPIDIPDAGVYICNNAARIEPADYRRRNAGRSRIIEAVARHPEQTLEQAYANIQARRVTLSFVGVDSNNQKFGIAPDGHIVVGNTDPSFGEPIRPSFAIYFDTSEEPLFFQPAAENLRTIEDQDKAAAPKVQSLEEGWLPILTTAWSQNDLSFRRTDYAHLYNAPSTLDVDALRGNEPVILISRLIIRNDSPVAKTARYYIRPWKPATGNLSYGPIPGNVADAWLTGLREDWATVTESGREYALCRVDLHGRGSLALTAPLNAVRYSLEIHPGEEHTIHLITPGWSLPVSENAKLANVDYDQMFNATVQYWKDRLSEGMQIQIPNKPLQNIYNATQHHFLLAMTKDGKRGEYYPNTAMFNYGSIGSESSPIMQALDMRGMHQRVRGCLQSWLSTQGDSMPAGDYATKEGGFFRFWPIYTIDQGTVLWALAEHYLYTRDKDWLRAVAPQIVAGCDFLIRERKRTKVADANGKKPLHYGLAPAGCVADPRDWEYSFMLNGYFYLGLKKSAQVLEEVDAANARRIGAEAADYLEHIRRALRESIALSPVTRLRDNTSVPAVPSYVGLRGFSSDVKDSVDPDRRHGYAYDVTIGPFHLLKSEVLQPGDPEVSWMLNILEDRFFLFSPLPSRVNYDRLSTDWFNLGGFEKLQPYYVHYQDAYLQRDQIPNFLRGFFNTLASISDPQTLTFQEELDFGGAQPHKTHEESWFFHQIRFMLIMEMGNDLFLARGTPREWLEDGKQIAVSKAPSYFGELGYRIRSLANQGKIEAAVNPPHRNPPANLYLRLRHPRQARMTRVTVNGRLSNQFDPAKEWISLPAEQGELHVVAYYG